MKIIAVTPAGRRIYLQLLSAHILGDSSIDEWHLWDNCRLPEDRVYIRDLAARFPDKIRIVERTRSNGSLRSINRFYDDCTREDAFYLKIDDDVVWLSPGCAGRLCARATAERGSHIWWSPMVINNAICSWLLERRGTAGDQDEHQGEHGGRLHRDTHSRKGESIAATRRRLSGRR